jgi:transcriptional regulator with XRE-family HTH domain
VKTLTPSAQRFFSAIGRKIALDRKSKNITQEEMCESVNLTQATLSRYETGKTSIDTLVLFEICQVTETDFAKLVTAAWELIHSAETHDQTDR